MPMSCVVPAFSARHCRASLKANRLSPLRLIACSSENHLEQPVDQFLEGNHGQQQRDQGQEREHRLRAMIGRIASRLPPELRDDPEIASIIAEGRAHPATVLYLSYRAALDEAGPANVFDFSRATFADRWQKGEREMRGALRTLAARDGTARRAAA